MGHWFRSLRMIICADDYGLRDDINASILELCSLGRLSAVSCLAVLQRCDRASLAQLVQYHTTVQVGLHFCLTDEGLPMEQDARSGSPLYYSSFGPLLRHSLMGRLQPGAMLEPLTAQYRLFVEKCGREPDFVDGHLHVHQFPGVREAVIQFVSGLPAGARPYIRNTALSLRELRRRRLPWLKAAFIGAFGAGMLRRLRAARLQTNDGFVGIYQFDGAMAYRELLPRFLDCLGRPNGLLVVHPGGQDLWRRREYETLLTTSFEPGTINRFLQGQAPTAETTR